jgi:hypothetical protein
MSRTARRLLLACGTLLFLSYASSPLIGRVTNRRVLGLVLGPDKQPIAGAMVLLSDGSGPPRSIYADSAGRFRMPVTPERLDSARLMVCAPGLRPLRVKGLPRNAMGRSTFNLSYPAYNEPPVTQPKGWPATLPAACRGATRPAA